MSDVQETLPRGRTARMLDAVESIGNKLPDPALLFAILLIAVWVCSWILSGFTFEHIDPRTGEAVAIRNLLTGAELTAFTSSMVDTFVGFHPYMNRLPVPYLLSYCEVQATVD